MDRTGRWTDGVDLLSVADRLPGEPPVGLREIEDPGHPRVVRARAHRDDVRVWRADEGGVVVLGRGVAGRWECAVEVDAEARGRGLGARLALWPPGISCRAAACGRRRRPATPAACAPSRRRATGRCARRCC